MCGVSYRRGGADLEFVAGGGSGLEVGGGRHPRQQRGNRLLPELPFVHGQRTVHAVFKGEQTMF